jgi:hypothetical protein
MSPPKKLLQALVDVQAGSALVEVKIFAKPLWAQM